MRNIFYKNLNNTFNNVRYFEMMSWSTFYTYVHSWKIDARQWEIVFREFNLRFRCGRDFQFMNNRREAHTTGYNERITEDIYSGRHMERDRYPRFHVTLFSFFLFFIFIFLTARSGQPMNFEFSTGFHRHRGAPAIIAVNADEGSEKRLY